jgi:arylsulfatase
MGNRAIYYDDWMASARSGLLPWVYARSSENMMQQPWELYDLSKDYSEANNLAHQYPDKVKQMQSLFDEEAKKNQVYPLDPRMSGRGFHAPAGHSTFYSGAVHLYNELAPPFERKSHTITAYVDIPKEGANGVLMAEGAEGGGFALFLKDGRPTYTYNFFRKSTTIASPTALPPGPAKIVLQLTYSGTGLNKIAVATLSVNDRQVATTQIARTVPNVFFV